MNVGKKIKSTILVVLLAGQVMVPLCAHAVQTNLQIAVSDKRSTTQQENKSKNKSVVVPEKSQATGVFASMKRLCSKIGKKTVCWVIGLPAIVFIGKTAIEMHACMEGRKEVESRAEAEAEEQRKREELRTKEEAAQRRREEWHAGQQQRAIEADGKAKEKEVTAREAAEAVFEQPPRVASEKQEWQYEGLYQRLPPELLLDISFVLNKGLSIRAWKASITDMLRRWPKDGVEYRMITDFIGEELVFRCNQDSHAAPDLNQWWATLFVQEPAINRGEAIAFSQRLALIGDAGRQEVAADFGGAPRHQQEYQPPAAHQKTALEKDIALMFDRGISVEQLKINAGNFRQKWQPVLTEQYGEYREIYGYIEGCIAKEVALRDGVAGDSK